MKCVLESLERRTFLDGALVSNWGVGGILFIKATVDVANVAPRPDGSVIAHTVRANDELLYRLGTDGLVDTSFVAQPAVGFDVAAQSDNSVLYATPFGVRRYSPTGTLDGILQGPRLNSTPNPALIEAFTRLPDNSFTVAGRNDIAAPTWSGIEWFNADGTHRVSLDQSGTIVQLTGQADGKLIALIKTSSGYMLERFQSSGQIDPTFANDAIIAAPADARFTSVSLDALGRIYIAGLALPTGADNVGYYFTRLLPSGQLDTSYGNNGLVSTFPIAHPEHTARVAPDGRMYLAAILGTNLDNDRAIAVFRFGTNGKLDTTWGDKGRCIVDITDQTDSLNVPRVHDLEFMADGDVVVSGVGARVTAQNYQARTGVVFRLDVETQIVNLGGIITITGRPIADAIYVKTLADGRVSATANGFTRIFAESSVSGVSISGGDGNDYIDLRALRPLPHRTALLPVTLMGDAGDDVILGSLNSDRIIGGDGNDRIAGMDGSDVISGSANSDRITAGPGEDSVLGNGGRDYLSGEAGNDTLLGGDQPDVLSGGDGDDSLAGEGGHDHLTGGAGTDNFSGGGGNDTFFADDNVIETIVGGLAGSDTAYADKDDLLIGVEVPVV
jgi:uncharacterized delta-60 repeat protein